MVIHQYFGIYDETIWDIVENQIPKLVTNISTIFDKDNYS
jgi:uncharacterized protein with HEPN domain